MKAITDKALSNDTSIVSKFFAYLGKGKSFVFEDHCYLNVPRQSFVPFVMFFFWQHLQIINRVVSDVFVFVMNVLSCGKFTSQNLFHDKAMFGVSSAVHGNSYVAFYAHPPCRIFAKSSAVIFSRGNFGFLAFKFLPAVLTFKGDYKSAKRTSFSVHRTSKD